MDDDNDRHLARLCEIYFPSHRHHHQQQQQQQQQQRANAYEAPAIDLAEHRRQLIELYEMQTQQHHHQQMMLQQMYWQQMQQVNQIVQNQNPHQIINSNDPQTNKSEKKKKEAAYLVAAANLEAADKWAWRKYGQKPIKGCTYPRSYYKCTSSKGCNAKKQVEKILVDPDIYMVTYKGEHAHVDPVQPILLPGSVLDSIFGDATNPVPEMAQPRPDIAPEMAQTPPEIAPEIVIIDDDEDKDKLEEDLLIPNLMMVDQDMLSSMEELKKYYRKCNDSGYDGSGSSGGLKSN